MSHSEQINEIATALAKAQGEMDPAIFDKINTHFKSKYASYVAVREATRKQLSKYGIALIETTETDGNGSFVLHTFLVHSSGQWFRSDHPLPGGAQPHALASARTYARRGSLQGIVGIAGDDDDDGNEAQKAPPPIAKPIAQPAGEPHEIPLGESMDDEGWLRIGRILIAAAATKDWPDWDELNHNVMARMQNEVPKIHAGLLARIKKARAA